MTDPRLPNYCNAEIHATMLHPVPKGREPLGYDRLHLRLEPGLQMAMGSGIPSGFEVNPFQPSHAKMGNVRLGLDESTNSIFIRISDRHLLFGSYRALLAFLLCL